MVMTVTVSDDQAKAFLKLWDEHVPGASHIVAFDRIKGLMERIFGAAQQRKDAKTEGRLLVKALNERLRAALAVAGKAPMGDVFVVAEVTGKKGIARTKRYSHLKGPHLLEEFYPRRAGLGVAQALADPPLAPPMPRPAAAAPPTRAPWYQTSPTAERPPHEAVAGARSGLHVRPENAAQQLAPRAPGAELAASDAGVDPSGSASTSGGGDHGGLEDWDGSSASTADDSSSATSPSVDGDAPAPDAMPEDTFQRLQEESRRLQEENRTLQEENRRLQENRRMEQALQRLRDANDAEYRFRCQLAAEARRQFDYSQDAVELLWRLGDPARLCEYQAIKFERDFSFHRLFGYADSKWPDHQTIQDMWFDDSDKSDEYRQRLCKHCTCVIFLVRAQQLQDQIRFLEGALRDLGLEVKTLWPGTTKDLQRKPMCTFAFRHVPDAEALCVNRRVRDRLFGSAVLRIHDIRPLVPPRRPLRGGPSEGDFTYV